MRGFACKWLRTKYVCCSNSTQQHETVGQEDARMCKLKIMVQTHHACLLVQDVLGEA